MIIGETTVELSASLSDIAHSQPPESLSVLYLVLFYLQGTGTLALPVIHSELQVHPTYQARKMPS